MSAQTDSSVLDAVALQQQLDEKDQLVHALTERLEQAAEQLDRIKRSGGQVNGRNGGGSSEMSPQQQSLIEQLTQSLETWEDVQPRDAFERIEARLDGIRDLLESSEQAVRAPRSDKSAEKQEALSGWEKMKAQLMDGEAVDKPAVQQATPSTDSKPRVENLDPQPSADPPAAGTVSLPPVEEQSLPEPVDFDVAEREELEDAIECRNKYISYLTGRLRSAESRRQAPIDWEALNNAPDELRESLEQLEAELEDRLRIAEVDLSLERARLSRVETRIRGMQQQIERRLASAGHRGNGDSDESELPESTEKKKKDPLSKSWFGSLGR